MGMILTSWWQTEWVMRVLSGYERVWTGNQTCLLEYPSGFTWTAKRALRPFHGKHPWNKNGYRDRDEISSWDTASSDEKNPLDSLFLGWSTPPVETTSSSLPPFTSFCQTSIIACLGRCFLDITLTEKVHLRDPSPPEDVTVRFGKESVSKSRKKISKIVRIK